MAERGLALLPLETTQGMLWVPSGAYVLIVGKSPRGDFNPCVVGRATPEGLRVPA